MDDTGLSYLFLTAAHRLTIRASGGLYFLALVVQDDQRREVHSLDIGTGKSGIEIGKVIQDLLPHLNIEPPEES